MPAATTQTTANGAASGEQLQLLPLLGVAAPVADDQRGRAGERAADEDRRSGRARTSPRCRRARGRRAGSRRSARARSSEPAPRARRRPCSASRRGREDDQHGRHAREGRRPVGMKKRLAIISPKPAIQNHSLNHETQVSAAPEPSCSGAEVSASPTLIERPKARKSQPTGFAGRSAAMTAPEDRPHADEQERRVEPALVVARRRARPSRARRRHCGDERESATISLSSPSGARATRVQAASSRRTTSWSSARRRSSSTCSRSRAPNPRAYAARRSGCGRSGGRRSACTRARSRQEQRGDDERGDRDREVRAAGERREERLARRARAPA